MLSNVRKVILCTTSIVTLIMLPPTAHADKNDLLKIIGGVAAGLAVGAMSNNQDQQNLSVTTSGRTEQPQVQWNDPAQNPKPVKRSPRPDHNVLNTQNLLQKAGYYSGKIDGISSESTLKALNRFQEDFELPVTAKINDKTAEHIYIIHRHFSCHADYAEVSKNGMNNKDDLIIFYRTRTDNLVNDFQEYIKSNNVSVDTTEASNAIIAVKKAQRDKRSCITKEYNNLVNYTNSVEGFSAYIAKKDNERLQEESKVKNDLKLEVEQYRMFSDHYLKNNLGNEKAISLKDMLSNEPDASNVSLSVYSDYLTRIKGLIQNDYNTRSAYTTWNNTRLQNQAIKSKKKSFWDIFKKTNNTQNLNSDPLSTSRYKFEIVRLFETVIVGGSFDEVRSHDDNTFIVVDFKYKNISGKPLSSFKKPKIYLKDDKGRKYKSDKLATLSYLNHMDVEEKWFSEINPDVTVDSAAVFEINGSSPRTNWTIVLDAEEEIEVPLIVGGDNFKTSDDYKKFTPNQRKQLERVEKDPSKFWEAFIEIDEEARRKESLDNLLRKYR
jgi:peptidoglycan hydrolase-like protein with peptidoglycan-binding domain